MAAAKGSTEPGPGGAGRVVTDLSPSRGRNYSLTYPIAITIRRRSSLLDAVIVAPVLPSSIANAGNQKRRDPTG